MSFLAGDPRSKLKSDLFTLGWDFFRLDLFFGLLTAIFFDRRFNRRGFFAGGLSSLSQSWLRPFSSSASAFLACWSSPIAKTLAVYSSPLHSTRHSSPTDGSGGSRRNLRGTTLIHSSYSVPHSGSLLLTLRSPVSMSAPACVVVWTSSFV